MLKQLCVVSLIVIAALVLPLTAQAQPGFSEYTLTSEGVEREYLMYLPSSYDGSPVPLVFSFHGSGGVPRNQVETSGFHELAQQHGFAVVFPAGAFANSVSGRSWNANLEAGVDDVQFVRDMIQDLVERVNVDPRRIYASGFSGGGRISSRLACELSDVLAAAAPVAGLQYPDGCTVSRPIPIISFHAVDDPVNQYEVGANSRAYWRMGVETALDRWRQANGCTLVSDDEQLSQVVTFYRWSECAEGAEIHFYLTTTGGHTWPGSGNANQDIDASELIWEFFSRHHLP